MRAAVYARYSSDLQSDASIEDQVRVCREFAAKEGHSIAEVFADYALSGGHLNSRPGMLSLLDAAKQGQFDIVIAEALDRVSRDQEDVAAIFKRLTHADIPIQTLSEGRISELHIGLKGTMNALFLKDLAQKTKRGMRGRVRAGKSGGGITYGYDVVKSRDANGDPVRGERRINKGEAEVVLRIFRNYGAGKSPRMIAKELNAEGIPGPRGNTWGPSTIHGNASRGTGILNNELYIGRLVWNRLRYIKDPVNGKRQSRLNPEDQWIIRDVPELLIIDSALWETVKVRQKSLRATRRNPSSGEAGYWDRRRPRHLLSGLMKCGACGGGYTKINTHLFGCARARDRGTCNNRLNIRRDVLERIILDALKTRLMDPDLVKTFADEFVAETNRLRSRQNVSRDAVIEERKTIRRRTKSLVDAISEGAAPKALVEELRRVEAREAEIDRQLAEAPASPQPLLHPNMGELYRRKVAELETLLEDENSRDPAFETIRSLIEGVVLRPENGELVVDLEGQLASILSLCSDTQKPATVIRDGLEQLKLVAGARNHQARITLTIKRDV